MLLDDIRSLDDDLFQRMIRSIPPRQLVAQMARLDRRIFYRWFKGYRPDKISRAQVTECVRKEVIDGSNESFGELLVVAWNASHWDLYEAMRKNVAKINPNVEAIEKIEDEQAREIVSDLKENSFEDEDIYICTVLNEVRFTPEFKATLKPGAAADPVEGAEAAQPAESAEAAQPAESAEAAEPAEAAATAEPDEQAAPAEVPPAAETTEPVGA
jgi:hypothetical protein